MDFFKIKDNHSVIELNPDLFSLDVAYSAAYTLLEKAFITFDGDPESEILVKLSFKDESENTKSNLEDLSKEFHNNLINENANRLGSNKKEYLRALLLKKSFKEINLESLDESINLTDDNACVPSENDQDNLFTDEDFDDDLDEDFEFDDPEGIAVPWDEKFSDDDTSGEGNIASNSGEDDISEQDEKLKSDTSLGLKSVSATDDDTSGGGNIANNSGEDDISEQDEKLKSDTSLESESLSVTDDDFDDDFDDSKKIDSQWDDGSSEEDNISGSDGAKNTPTNKDNVELEKSTDLDLSESKDDNLGE